MKKYEAKSATLVIDGHTICGFADVKPYITPVVKANEAFRAKLEKILEDRFVEKVAKYCFFAGDGKNKYVRAHIISFDPIDLDVDVTEECMEDYTKLTDDEFKQLLDDCNVNIS